MFTSIHSFTKKNLIKLSRNSTQPLRKSLAIKIIAKVRGWARGKHNKTTKKYSPAVNHPKTVEMRINSSSFQQPCNHKQQEEEAQNIWKSLSVKWGKKLFAASARTAIANSNYIKKYILFLLNPFCDCNEKRRGNKIVAFIPSAVI